MTKLLKALLFYVVVILICTLIGCAGGSMETFSAGAAGGLLLSNLLYWRFKGDLEP